MPLGGDPGHKAAGLYGGGQGEKGWSWWLGREGMGPAVFWARREVHGQFGHGNGIFGWR